MAGLVDILSWLCLLLGGAFGVIAGIGILRFPDFFTRIHAAGIGDTLAPGLILLGLALQGGASLTSAKLLLIFVFLVLTSPTASHALAKAALHGGIRPLGKRGQD